MPRACQFPFQYKIISSNKNVCGYSIYEIISVDHVKIDPIGKYIVLLGPIRTSRRESLKRRVGYFDIHSLTCSRYALDIQEVVTS
jgi:hypothetical protein